MFFRNIVNDLVSIDIFSYLLVAFVIYCIFLFIKRLVMPR